MVNGPPPARGNLPSGVMSMDQKLAVVTRYFGLANLRVLGGVEIDGDGGKSIGPFQMDSTTALWVADSSRMDLGILPKDIRAVLENDRTTAADMALWYFDYWYKKHLKWLGPGPNHEKIAWGRAVASYKKGYDWRKVSDELITLASSWVGYFKRERPCLRPLTN